MADKILLISYPDDLMVQGFRILVFDLSEPQSQIFSQSVLSLNTNVSCLVYNADVNTDMPWLSDKIIKSNLIIYNAESDNQLLVGYLSAKSNSYYFGTLRDLSSMVVSQIFDSKQLKEILERKLEIYGQ
jgi:hypothetical protein